MLVTEVIQVTTWLTCKGKLCECKSIWKWFAVILAMRGMRVDAKLTSHYESVSEFEWKRMSRSDHLLIRHSKFTNSQSCGLFCLRVH